VIHDFEAKEEDEVFVAKGEKVRVLNAEDPQWLWIETTPGDEGFVPRMCLSLGNHPCKC
jgi:oxalate decarboxylase/phosphoglucose isomerase-like protein (cupin superfamily)